MFILTDYDDVFSTLRKYDIPPEQRARKVNEILQSLTFPEQIVLHLIHNILSEKNKPWIMMELDSFVRSIKIEGALIGLYSLSFDEVKYLVNLLLEKGILLDTLFNDSDSTVYSINYDFPTGE